MHDTLARHVSVNFNHGNNYKFKETKMLTTIAVILLVLWALGLLTSYTMSGFIHVLLVLAIVVFLINVFQGRRLA
jgi:Family of unknown function (DUF5670)